MNRHPSLHSSLLAVALLVLLSACSGSGSDESSEPVSPPPIGEVTTNQPPVIQVQAPSPSTNPDDQQPVSLSASASDAEDGEISGQIEWRSDVDGLLGRGGQISPTLSGGDHRITVSVSDSQQRSTSTTLDLTINTSPSINIIAPTAGSQFSATDSLNFVAEANDDEDGSLDQDIEWYSDLDGLIGSGANISPQLSQGVHQITVQVTDSGNTGTSRDIAVELIANYGVAVLNWDAPTENTNGTPLVDLRGYKIYYGPDQENWSNSVTIEDSSTESYAIEQLPVGVEIFFSVTAMNEEGIESDFSNTVSKLISD